MRRRVKPLVAAGIGHLLWETRAHRFTSRVGQGAGRVGLGRQKRGGVRPMARAGQRGVLARDGCWPERGGESPRAEWRRSGPSRTWPACRGAAWGGQLGDAGRRRDRSRPSILDGAAAEDAICVASVRWRSVSNRFQMRAAQRSGRRPDPRRRCRHHKAPRPVNIGMMISKSAPAWNRVDPHRLPVFCVNHPQQIESAKVARRKTSICGA
jgi:hypothetical protein